ncbi:hypothetical protein [Maridesulfovibrio frigidus]|uniref:hypothetical protein n=1 Tax=Maridesulfovibrio frigidus TaxID=340956 RepID=UPI0004E183DB|nr:hypothetical protein [Maridesulfovibrio frigidus]
MNSNNKAISASEFPVALFCLGLPLILAAFAMDGTAVPKNLLDLLVTGLALLGLLSEPFRRKLNSTTPLWIKAGVPCVAVFWFLTTYLSPNLKPFAMSVPFLMELRPILYGLVAALWLSLFSPPEPKHFYFWASWLGVLVICDFVYQVMSLGLIAAPSLFGSAALTGPLLLAGLCATLHDVTSHKTTRFIIFLGILCTLSRDTSFAAVTILLFFGPKGTAKKSAVVIALLLFNYLSIAPQESTFFTPNDLPTYWLWFSFIELFSNNTGLLLTGFPLSVPLPLSVPASLWNTWHSQHHAWTDSGIYMFHVLPLWLHLVGTWGLGALAGTATIATWLSRRFSSDMMSSLLTTVVISGFFFPIFYNPATGIVMIMAFMCAIRPEVRSFRFE